MNLFIHNCTCACVVQRLRLNVLPNHSPPYVLSQCLSLNLEIEDSPSWLVREPQGSSCLCLPVHPHMPGLFHMGFRRLNPGPHAWVAGTLHTESSPQRLLVCSLLTCSLFHLQAPSLKSFPGGKRQNVLIFFTKIDRWK